MGREFHTPTPEPRKALRLKSAGKPGKSLLCRRRYLKAGEPGYYFSTADFNAMIDGKRYHQNGGGSFVLQPPKMLDRPVFQRWFKSLDNVHDWEDRKSVV